MIRILVVDDVPAILESLADLLGTCTDMRVVGTAADGGEAVEQALRLRPDVVIMDAQMPGMDGVEATAQIKTSLPSTSILFLSVFRDHIESAMKAGADGYLAKDCDPEQLLAELRKLGEAT